MNNTPIEIIKETNIIIDCRIMRLRKFCNSVCTDNKSLCDVCAVKAMRYALRNFQIVFDGEK